MFEQLEVLSRKNSATAATGTDGQAAGSDRKLPVAPDVPLRRPSNVSGVSSSSSKRTVKRSGLRVTDHPVASGHRSDASATALKFSNSAPRPPRRTSCPSLRYDLIQLDNNKQILDFHHQNKFVFH